MIGFHTTLGTADAGCTTNHGPMVRRLPLLRHGAVGGLAHATSIRGEPRARHLGSEQGISHPPDGGSAPDVPCLGGQVRNVPPVTDRSGISQRLPRSGPGYDGPSERAGLDRSDCTIRYNSMEPNSYAPAGKPALPVPAVAQHHVGFLPAVDGGVSASEGKMTDTPIHTGAQRVSRGGRRASVPGGASRLRRRSSRQRRQEVSAA